MSPPSRDGKRIGNRTVRGDNRRKPEVILEECVLPGGQRKNPAAIADGRADLKIGGYR